MEWRPREQALRNRGRPPTRWTNDVKRISTNWIQAAQNQKKMGIIERVLCSAVDEIGYLMMMMTSSTFLQEMNE